MSPRGCPPSAAGPGVRLQVVVPRDLARDIAECAAALGLTTSAALRVALRDWAAAMRRQAVARAEAERDLAEDP